MNIRVDGNRPWLLAVVVIGAAGIAGACGSDDSNGGGTGGSGGSGAVDAGTGGTSGSAGAAGMAGGGAAGSSGSAGAAGGGAGGLAGSGGMAGGTAFAAYPDVPYPPENPYSEEKAVLGKILFWEEQMSSDDTMACGTCHRAAAGGSDPRSSQTGAIHPGPDGSFGTSDDRRGAMGVQRCEVSGGNVMYKSDATFGTAVQVTKRKPPSYLDAMFAADVFWDGRATSQFRTPDTNELAIMAGGALESQSMGPPLSDAEMACENRTWADIITKLQSVQPLALARNIPNDMKDFIAANPTYPDMFAAVYGSSEISTKRIAFAIATHERNLTSNQTPWDRWNAGDMTAMTPAQVRGFELFMDKAKCRLCHAPPLFTDGIFHNIGFVALDVNFDAGREEFTGDMMDRGKVKTPTLRNVGLRVGGGLLHSGHENMQQVMEAYNVPPNLSSPVDPLIEPLNLTQQEIDDVIDFQVNALTDPRVAAEQAPFDRPTLSTE